MSIVVTPPSHTCSTEAKYALRNTTGKRIAFKVKSQDMNYYPYFERSPVIPDDPQGFIYGFLDQNDTDTVVIGLRGQKAGRYFYMEIHYVDAPAGAKSAKDLVSSPNTRRADYLIKEFI